MDNPYDQGNVGEQSGSTGTAARMKETVKDAADQATGKVSELGRKAVSQIDSTREPIANTLDKSASTLHETGDSAARAAHATADKLQSTARYVRQNDLQAMLNDIQELAKQHPGPCLAAAVGVGFLLGRMFRSTD
ncbi:MAG TPA: hypothetical protein VK709_08610 [Candidatus Saccharimonadales bacterium]|jgi:ElaB/YqjD/DUF883 family membrane-anchored ribosome-binding protein|nr:hypothetical protein [Candidatus Saccharimonadales bacterium]